MVEYETFDYEELVKHRGTKKRGFLDIGTKPDGSMMRIPYVIAVGIEEGPTLLMDGGIHGDEVEGAEAIAHVFDGIDPMKLKGVYLGVPHLNLEGFNIGKRVASSIDYAATDMNRVFPGDEVHGKVSAYIISKYVKHFVEHANYWVTFHSGGNTLYIEPIACYTNPEKDDVFGDLTLNMAKCFMTKYLWLCNPGGGKEGSRATMRDLSEAMKIAYICLEMGGNAAIFKEREKIYNMCHNGIINLMNFIKMTDGPVPQFRQDTVSVDVDYLHVTNGGIYHPEKYIFDKVDKGERLGYVTNIFGDVIDELFAPYDGTVVGTWTPPVIQPREWGCLFGKFMEI
ncbi:succinylglutamate desuccinylase/aspartoacylase family protein [Anaerotignum faecicola]|nr:succinylglutamate desuccinylase/aspartoacylase family protein [Anaerotignum faecicola]